MLENVLFVIYLWHRNKMKTRAFFEPIMCFLKVVFYKGSSFWHIRVHWLQHQFNLCFLWSSAHSWFILAKFQLNDCSNSRFLSPCAIGKHDPKNTFRKFVCLVSSFNGLKITALVHFYDFNQKKNIKGSWLDIKNFITRSYTGGSLWPWEDYKRVKNDASDIYKVFCELC